MAGPFAGAALMAAVRAAGGLRGILATGAFGGLASALPPMLNQEESMASKTGSFIGSGLAVPGALGGAALGGALAGGRFRPYGAVAGSIGGGLLGGGIGAGVLGAGARQLAGENEDPIVKAANAQLEIERRRMEQLMPLQARQASMANRLEADRAREMMSIQSQMERQQAANQMMLNGQQSAAALQQQLMASILGGGFGV